MSMRIGNVVYIDGQPALTIDPNEPAWDPNFEGIDFRAIRLKPGAVVMLRMPEDEENVGLTSSSAPHR